MSGAIYLLLLMYFIFINLDINLCYFMSSLTDIFQTPHFLWFEEFGYKRERRGWSFLSPPQIFLKKKE